MSRATSTGGFGRLRPGAASILAVKRLGVRYAGRDGVPVHALQDLHFNLLEGETLGVVGESGCGKSTLARTLAGLERASAGAINFDGRDLSRLSEERWRPLRRQIQMVFQDPASSLDPRMTVARIVDEPLDALYADMARPERRDRVADSLARVGLSPDFLGRYPHELSGGQAQRVAIARALVVRPRILVCDEPVSALDASVQAQILNLLRKLQQDDGLSLIFIAHDLAAVRYVSHRVMVMYLGRIMEIGPVDAVLGRPMHPYTRALLAALPGADPARRASALREGELPDPRTPPSGCVFRSRCPMADDRCGLAVPAARRTASGSMAACLYAPEPPERVRLPEPQAAPEPRDEEEGPDPFR